MLRRSSHFTNMNFFLSLHVSFSHNLFACYLENYLFLKIVLLEVKVDTGQLFNKLLDLSENILFSFSDSQNLFQKHATKT